MSIVNSDEMLKSWGEQMNEFRRMLQFKNLDRKNLKFSIESFIDRYIGKSICQQKFNFQVNGNKCKHCNSLSFLFVSGDIDINKPFKIKSGENKGKTLIIEQFSKHDTQTTFDIIEDKELITKIKNHFPQIDVCSKVMTNYNINFVTINNDDLHYIICSILINYYWSLDNTIYSSRFLYFYICDHLNIVKVAPNLGIGTLELVNKEYSTIKNKKRYLDRNIVYGILFQIFTYYYNFLREDNQMSHGSPSLEYLSFNKENLTCATQLKSGKIIEMENFPIRLYIDPCKYTSFIYVDIYQIKNHIIKSIEPNIFDLNPIDVSFFFQDIKSKKDTCKNDGCSNLSLDKYLEKRRVRYKPTRDLIFFIRNSGFLPFPSFDLYLYVTSLMMNDAFYNTMIEDPQFIKMLKIMISPEQYDNFLSELKYKHNMDKTYNCDQTLEFLISLEIDMKCDIVKDLCSELKETKEKTK